MRDLVHSAESNLDLDLETELEFNFPLIIPEKSYKHRFRSYQVMCWFRACHYCPVQDHKKLLDLSI